MLGARMTVINKLQQAIYQVEDDFFMIIYTLAVMSTLQWLLYVLQQFALFSQPYSGDFVSICCPMVERLPLYEIKMSNGQGGWARLELTEPLQQVLNLRKGLFELRSSLKADLNIGRTNNNWKHTCTFTSSLSGWTSEKLIKFFDKSHNAWCHADKKSLWDFGAETITKKCFTKKVFTGIVWVNWDKSIWHCKI